MILAPGYTGYRAQVSTSYGAAIEVQGAGTDVWLSVYNDAGAAVTNGDIKLLSFKVSSGVLQPVLIAPATNTTVGNQVVVVDNSIVGLGTIADATWGFVKVSGYVLADVDGTADLVAGDQLQVINAGVALIDQGSAQGAVIDADTCAIMLEAYTTNAVALKSVFLLGNQCAVAAA